MTDLADGFSEKPSRGVASEEIRQYNAPTDDNPDE